MKIVTLAPQQSPVQSMPFVGGSGLLDHRRAFCRGWLAGFIASALVGCITRKLSRGLTQHGMIHGSACLRVLLTKSDKLLSWFNVVKLP